MSNSNTLATHAILRAMAWQRAKCELYAMLDASFSNLELTLEMQQKAFRKWEALRNSVDKFIAEVETGELHR